ncbi:ABC transporter permease [Heyndrickxia ginsengihumi]|uniref:ABC transporter permease n=1 Tax=Heyndrickxia ginsengihumi TaxID=363870 RepID=UPI00203BAD81|nr:FtsX-like permease family protein [Heyndrickxia ginsengihumi]
MSFRQFVFRNVIRNKRTYSAYFLSSSFSVLIFFVYALFIFHPDIKKGVTAATAVQLMTAAEVIMYVFSFLFVFYSVSTFLKTRKREFGILIMHGMTRGQLVRMVFLENMIIGIGAIILGIMMGIITGKLFLMIGSNMLGIKSLPFYLSPKALCLTIIAFFVLFFCISLFTTVLVQVNKLIDLFQSGEKPKKAPKVSIILSLLSAILLFVSYYLAATTTLKTILFRILPVIGMTIVGTYFFYTQLSVFIIKLLQKNRLIFWKKTNIVTISSLAYRLKDNANMFFMVTIVSTVAFCAIGTLASSNAVNREIKTDYPATVSYIAQDHNPIHEQHLREIKEEFNKRNLSYKSTNVAIKVVKVHDNSQEKPKLQIDQMPVISFSSYKKMSKLAGFDVDEKALVGNEARLMLASHLKIDLKPQSYTIQQGNITLDHLQSTKNIVFPYEMILSEGLVVSDELFRKLKPVKTEMYTGFYTKSLPETAGMASNLVEKGMAFPNEKNTYSMIVSGTLYANQMSMYKMMLFVALLVGLVFFVAAGSFLYFRLYSDLEYDTRQYLTIKKIGLTDRELNSIVTRQMALLFFVPIVVAFVHSIFAFIALQTFYTVSIVRETVIVLACFFIAQLLYFFIIRSRYLRNLKKSLI